MNRPSPCLIYSQSFLKFKTAFALETAGTPERAPGPGWSFHLKWTRLFGHQVAAADVAVVRVPTRESLTSDGQRSRKRPRTVLNELTPPSLRSLRPRLKKIGRSSVDPCPEEVYHALPMSLREYVATELQQLFWIRSISSELGPRFRRHSFPSVEHLVASKSSSLWRCSAQFANSQATKWMLSLHPNLLWRSLQAAFCCLVVMRPRQFFLTSCVARCPKKEAFQCAVLGWPSRKLSAKRNIHPSVNP